MPQRPLCPVVTAWRRSCRELWLNVADNNNGGDAVVAMCYIAHVVACFWYFVGGDEPHDDPTLAPQPGWISRQTTDVWNVTGDRTEVDTLLDLPFILFRFVTPCPLKWDIVD